ncbi:MAG: hypothetical protein ABSC31_14165 [Acidimicrobiales bacterium]
MSEKVPPPSTTPVAAARRRKTGGSLGEALVGVRVRRFAAIGHVRPSGVLSVPTSDADSPLDTPGVPLVSTAACAKAARSAMMIL